MVTSHLFTLQWRDMMHLLRDTWDDKTRWLIENKHVKIERHVGIDVHICTCIILISLINWSAMFLHVYDLHVLKLLQEGYQMLNINMTGKVLNCR